MAIERRITLLRDRAKAEGEKFPAMFWLFGVQAASVEAIADGVSLFFSADEVLVGLALAEAQKGECVKVWDSSGIVQPDLEPVWVLEVVDYPMAVAV